LSFVAYQQNDSSAAMVVEYSTNGFATAGVALCTNSPIHAAWTGSTNAVTLSGISALQNVAGTVTFRLWGYGFGAWQDKGLGQVEGNNDDVAVIGTVSTPVTLSMRLTGGSLELTWPQGLLLEADDVRGPWRTNAAPSPITIQPTERQKFYRVQVE
jgi:hypothetical protein